MKNQKMKRLAALIPLSRDHGIGLVCAQYGRKAVRACEDDRLQLAEQMRVVCHEEIILNLEDEQWILSPVIGDDKLRAEFHQRHRNIRELSAELSSVELSEDPGLGLVARIANALDDYVRWAEHTLFPRIEQGSECAQLQHVARLTADMEKQRNRRGQRLHSSIKLQQPSGLRTIAS